MTAPSFLDADPLPFATAEIKYGTRIEGVEKYRYDTVDRSRTNLKLEPRQVNIYDAKPRRDQLSLWTNGFALFEHSSKFSHLANSEMAGSLDDIAALRDDYQGEMAEFVRKISGTPHVFAQPTGFFVRHSPKSAVKTAARPANLVHADFTAETANEVALTIQAQEAPHLRFRHFAIYQTWRAVSPPPQDSALCFCDGRHVEPQDFLVVDSILGPEDAPGNVYKMQMGLYSSVHEWFYFSNLEANEVILFQGYDTRHPLPILHTSFRNADPSARPRASIESRLYAFFE